MANGGGGGVVANADDAPATPFAVVVACIRGVVVAVTVAVAAVLVVFAAFFVDLSKCSQNAEKLLKSIGLITSMAKRLEVLGAGWGV